MWTHWNPLQPPYCSPFRIVQHHKNTFNLLIQNQAMAINKDCLKPAVVTLDSISLTPVTSLPT